MTAYQTSFTYSKLRRVLRHLPLPYAIKCFIPKLHALFMKYEHSAFAEPGTLNNQKIREEIVRSILNEFQPSAIIETGTYLGAGTKFFLSNTETCPIASCEIHPDRYAFCKERFKDEPRISLSNSDSLHFLEHIAPDAAGADASVLFYLDAHWDKYLPLREEVDIIFRRWPEALIIIDDFAVPHDKGYEYDDYGPQKILNAAYLHNVRDNMLFYYPALPSARETGAKRGCVFVCLPATRAHTILSRHPLLSA